MLEYNIPGPSAPELRQARLIAATDMLPPHGQSDIVKALALAEKAHAGQVRRSGEDFVTHPLHVGLYLLDFGNPELNMGITDPDIISAAILHDAPEDIEHIEGEAFTNNADWLEKTDKWMEEAGINPRVRNFVAALTKPKIDNVEIFTEDGRRNRAIEQLKNAEPEVLLIKMADRLHNLQTLGTFDKWKAHDVITETQGVIYSVFSKILRTKYRREGMEMFRQMSKAICEFERSQNRWVNIYSYITTNKE